jgi:hypothetical protein
VVFAFDIVASNYMCVENKERKKNTSKTSGKVKTLWFFNIRMAYDASMLAMVITFQI